MRRLSGPALRAAISLAFCLALAATAGAQAVFDRAEFAARRARLFEQIKGSVVVLFAAEPHVHAVKFRQAPDFYYLTGIEDPGAVLLLNGRTREAFVFAARRPEWKVAVEGPGLLEGERPAERYGLTGAAPLENFLGALASAAQGAGKIYLPLMAPDTLQMGRGEMARHEEELAAHPLFGRAPAHAQAVERIRRLHPRASFADVSPLLDRLRRVKSPYEIELLRRSGRIGAESFKAAMRGTRPGAHEYEVEAAARFVVIRSGARGDAFTPIVASGPNTITWHYQANSRRMEEGDVVLMDYGADYGYYTSDVTRTWPVSGSFTPEQEKMYRTILEARDAVIAAIKPGATVKQLKAVAEEVYRRHGFHQQFLELRRYVGHPVGISVHDVEFGDDLPLEAGVVFNVEPLLELRDRRIHMRLEDTVLVTPGGAENLTAGVPADIPSVYALVRQKPFCVE